MATYLRTIDKKCRSEMLVFEKAADVGRETSHLYFVAYLQSWSIVSSVRECGKIDEIRNYTMTTMIQCSMCIFLLTMIHNELFIDDVRDAHPPIHIEY